MLIGSETKNILVFLMRCSKINDSIKCKIAKTLAIFLGYDPLGKVRYFIRIPLFLYCNWKIRIRIKNKKKNKRPLNIVFICHNPQFWYSFESLYSILTQDEKFCVQVVVVPYSHPVFGDAEYHDGGMKDFCLKSKIGYVDGYNKFTKNWLNLESLMPDFVFFQTPYDKQYHNSYRSWNVAQYAFICYIPYFGVVIGNTDVDHEKMLSPFCFFNCAQYLFLHESHKKMINRVVLNKKKFFFVGHPKLDYIESLKLKESQIWLLPREQVKLRILWTPRWNTKEGVCTFFDYKDILLQYARDNPDVEIIFRPHPLCFANFVGTGEFTENQLIAFREEVERISNFQIDELEQYQATFLTTDVLISDLSSMIGEYLVTKKALIYTHKCGELSDYTCELLDAAYWVYNKKGLVEVLCNLKNGKDPILEKRSFIVPKLLKTSVIKAHEQIKDVLLG